jgi:hypothetical protein
VRLVDAAVTWTALSALVTPLVGLHLARRRVEMRSEELVTTALSDRGTAAALDL